MTTDSALTATSALARARKVSSLLAEHADAADTARRLPHTTVDAVNQLKLFDLLAPKRFGGAELSIETQLMCSAALGEGCVATAWCHTVWGVHAWLLGHFPIAAQEAVWSVARPSGLRPLVSASLIPAGTSVMRESHAQLSGRWEFASGCDHADWVLLCAPISTTSNAPSIPHLFLLSPDQFHIDDTWYVSGLSGTGSKDIVVSEARIPVEHMVSMQDIAFARSPGIDAHGGSLLRNPLYGVLAVVLAGAPLGGARAAIEHFRTRLQSRVLASGRQQLELAAAHLRLAEACAEVDAAELLLRRVCSDLDTLSRCVEPAPLEARARLTRDTAFAVRACARVVNRIYEASGAHGLRLSSPLQRIWRDVNAAATHATLNWDTQGESYGRIALGLEPSMPRV
ncbi:MAG: hypothetical protein K0U93_09920 [Gammaproteobacteria bacterium]|nr:hypothetical protein [Gammaproteobacteria bacterium]